MVEQTSLEAYKKIFPELGARQLLVYNAIKKLEYCTNAMIARELKLPINTITPRTHELRKKNVGGEFLVVKSHVSRCPVTKNSAQYWKINETFK